NPGNLPPVTNIPVKPGPYGEIRVPEKPAVPEGVETAQETAARTPENVPPVTEQPVRPGPYGEAPAPREVVPEGVETAQETAARRPENLRAPTEVVKPGPYGEAPTETPMPVGASALGRIGAPKAEPASETGEALGTKAPTTKSGELGSIRVPGAEPASK